ncbi:mannitol-1-phosphate 5-dehydrogenase [Lysinibacillus sp. 2017]|uniref:mannitol-1-phosphate 5-dehydrogenase n=1 Tax=unclassified Lysinibacillus TaxID=2636778 RepID=UPI000D525CE0|nr:MULTISPECIES: mannitol-1-phosphate 5-dehydrogenase [unclassified Lysinibacillus]AWE07132.1 mannitol-1-phosphate 5-dehydrogenase [Lysinibacillus sp. 2017]TGN36948.1 mannitol-1-phosphate 5-dehydrogenase [Lysinibacillus sp. S2017]
MDAVHFGAGNIGRGFIGYLLYQSGFKTCFIDVNDKLVHLLNDKKQYIVEYANDLHEQFLVKDVHAINSSTHPDLVIEAIAKAEIVSTAVGPNILPHVAKLLVQGLKKRLKQSQPSLTIIACENMIDGSSYLKECVYKELTADEIAQFNKYFSFPNAAVDCIVPNQSNEDQLAVIVEPFYEWIVEQTKTDSSLPPIKAITYVKNLEPYIERKLFTVNTGHAIAAYGGYLEGILPIHEAVSNENVKKLMMNVLQETSKYLVTKHGFNELAHQEYVDKIINRFHNPYIPDVTTRVGRSPIRKLMANDRLVSPATKYVELFDEIPNHLAMGIAFALKYDYLEDLEAKQLQETIQLKGIHYAIEKFTTLKPGTELFNAIYNHYQEYSSNSIKGDDFFEKKIVRDYY